MSHLFQGLFAVLFLLLFYVAVPLGVVWGWARWFTRPQLRSWLTFLSFVSLALTTASCLLAVWSINYARGIGGFPYWDPMLLRIYRWGALLSLSAIITGLVGMWRRGPLRWLAAPCAIGSFLFWFAAATGE